MAIPKLTLTQDQIDRMLQENNDLRAKLIQASAPRALSCKVSEKGGLSVYGLNAKWPITLYADQWDRLFAYMPTIKAFSAANSKTLTRKADKAVA